MTGSSVPCFSVVTLEPAAPPCVSVWLPPPVFQRGSLWLCFCVAPSGRVSVRLPLAVFQCDSL